MQTQTQKITQDMQNSSDKKSPEATEKSLSKEDLIRTTSLRGQAKAANFGRANAGKLHKVHGDRRRNSSGLRVSVSWKAPEKLK